MVFTEGALASVFRGGDLAAVVFGVVIVHLPIMLLALLIIVLIMLWTDYLGIFIDYWAYFIQTVFYGWAICVFFKKGIDDNFGINLQYAAVY